MQSLESLRAKSYRASDRPESYAIAGPWREKSPDQGTQWLYRRAVDGDCFAMERLAERLLGGKQSTDKKEEALSWLHRASEAGSLSARYLLALQLLDHGATDEMAEGWDLLRQNAERGFLAAQREIGLRALTAKPATIFGLADAEHWLRSAACFGDRVAMIFLGRFLTMGRHVQSSPKEGMEWLVRAGCRNAGDVPRLGLLLYRRALDEFSPIARQRLCDEAASLFHEGQKNGDSSSSVNLAYMVRRGEVSAELFPPLDSLLAEGLARQNAFAMVNEALRWAAGIQQSVDWRKADAIIQSLSTTSGAYEWWSLRSQAGDSEGHLVLGWFVRHGLSADPDNVDYQQRLRLVSRDEWNIPEWMEGQKDEQSTARHHQR